jgi:hypothetical protein
MLNDQLRLRTIVVSATDAMQTVHDPVGRELIQARIFELLDDLRDRIVRDGRIPCCSPKSSNCDVRAGHNRPRASSSR